MLSKTLQNSIENLYQVFSKYPLKVRIGGCECCATDEVNDFLNLTPLRKLPSDELSYYGFKAMTTIGDVEDFKHFLSRLFEIAVNGKFSMNENSLFRKLDYGKWQNWDKKEIQVIDNFCYELYLYLLGFGEDNSYIIKSHFDGIKAVIKDYSRYFDLLLADLSEKSEEVNKTFDLWLESLSTLRIVTLHHFAVKSQKNPSSSNQFFELFKQCLISDKTIIILEKVFLENYERYLIPDFLEEIYKIKAN